MKKIIVTLALLISFNASAKNIQEDISKAVSLYKCAEASYSEKKNVQDFDKYMGAADEIYYKRLSNKERLEVQRLYNSSVDSIDYLKSEGYDFSKDFKYCNSIG